jgi:hypothetical protein
MPSPDARRILRLLQRHHLGLTRREICSFTGLGPEQVATCLEHLREARDGHRATLRARRVVAPQRPWFFAGARYPLRPGQQTLLSAGRELALLDLNPSLNENRAITRRRPGNQQPNCA